MLGDGSSVGIRGALAAGFMAIYQGTQPASADTGASGLQLGKVTVDDDGTTGLTFDAAAAGVLSKAAAEAWKFHGLADGVAGWFRFYPAGGNPTATSSTETRVDGLIGTAGADANMTNVNVVTDAVSSVDSCTITMPAS